MANGFLRSFPEIGPSTGLKRDGQARGARRMGRNCPLNFLLLDSPFQVKKGFNNGTGLVMDTKNGELDETGEDKFGVIRF